MKKTMLHSAIAAVITTFAVASSAAVITVDGTQKPITDTTIGGLVVQNGGSAVVDPKSRSKRSRYSSENDVLIEKSVKYTDFFLLSIVYV